MKRWLRRVLVWALERLDGPIDFDWVIAREFEQQFPGEPLPRGSREIVPFRGTYVPTGEVLTVKRDT